MTLKSDAKFEEKLTHGSKNDMRNLVNINAESGKSILFLSQKRTEELCIITLKNDAKFEKELIYDALKNGMRNLTNFDPTL